MSAFRLSLSYGCAPNLLGLCGPQEEKTKKIISDFIGGKKTSKEELKKIIKSFKGAYPYYQFIAGVNNIKDVLSEDVVRAYWTGNANLERVKSADFKKMVKEKFLLKKIPSGSLPHHSFHVLNIGRIGGKLKEDLIDVCLVKWGRVQKIMGSKVLVNGYEELKKQKKTFYLSSPKSKEVIWDKKLVPDLKIGDWVSIHWRNIIEKLNQEQLRNLKKYTKINLRAYSKSA